MANVAQLVRASGCGSEGRGFKTHHSPQAFTFVALCAIIKEWASSSAACPRCLSPSKVISTKVL